MFLTAVSALCVVQVRVANWSDLTPRALHGEWARIKRGVASGQLSLTKLYLPYWLHTFTAHMQSRAEYT